MKRYQIISLIISVFFLATCGDDESETYILTGTWVGPYSGIMGSGTMKAYLTQTGVDVTGTYSATSESDTGSIMGEVDGDEFLVQATSIPFACITYMKFSIQDSSHMSGYYRSYQTCADSGTASLVKQ